MACIDVNEQLISITEFDDDDFFAELEALIVLLGPKECVLPDADGEVSFLYSKNNHLITVNVIEIYF